MINLMIVVTLQMKKKKPEDWHQFLRLDFKATLLLMTSQLDHKTDKNLLILQPAIYF